MDPETKSVLTTILIWALSWISGLLVAHGYISQTDSASFISYGLAAAIWIINYGITYYKKRQVSPTALIQAVNSGKNGVKVVDELEPVPTVTKPLVGPESR